MNRGYSLLRDPTVRELFHHPPLLIPRAFAYIYSKQKPGGEDEVFS
jgi:hypothetical protein